MQLCDFAVLPRRSIIKEVNKITNRRAEVNRNAPLLPVAPSAQDICVFPLNRTYPPADPKQRSQESATSSFIHCVHLDILLLLRNLQWTKESKLLEKALHLRNVKGSFIACLKFTLCPSNLIVVQLNMRNNSFRSSVDVLT